MKIQKLPNNCPTAKRKARKPNYANDSLSMFRQLKRWAWIRLPEDLHCPECDHVSFGSTALYFHFVIVHVLVEKKRFAKSYFKQWTGKMVDSDIGFHVGSNYQQRKGSKNEKPGRGEGTMEGDTSDLGEEHPA